MRRVALVGLLLLVFHGIAGAEGTALTGTVSSAAEGKMEGVLVSAVRSDGPVTVTVVSDAAGRYRFPTDRLAPGPYTLSIRAVGYTLDETPSVTVASNRTATADLLLTQATDLAAQLTNTEWLESMPGSEQDKKALLECQSCHTVTSCRC